MVDTKIVKEIKKDNEDWIEKIMKTIYCIFIKRYEVLINHCKNTNFDYSYQEMFSDIYMVILKFFNTKNSNNVWALINYTVKALKNKMIRNTIWLNKQGQKVLNTYYVEGYEMKINDHNCLKYNNYYQEKCFEEILQTLTPLQRQIVTLRIKGYKFNEIAKKLNIKADRASYLFYSIKRNNQAKNMYEFYFQQ